MGNLDQYSGFLPSYLFRQCGDLDGKLAAEFLKSRGAANVEHRDLGTNGLAIGDFNGERVFLSTNGHMSWHHAGALPDRWIG